MDVVLLWVLKKEKKRKKSSAPDNDAGTLKNTRTEFHRCTALMENLRVVASESGWRPDVSLPPQLSRTRQEKLSNDAACKLEPSRHEKQTLKQLTSSSTCTLLTLMDGNKLNQLIQTQKILSSV